MNYYTKIQKAAAILEQVKALDSAIIKVEKHAELVSETDGEIKVSIFTPNPVSETNPNTDFDSEYRTTLEYMKMALYTTPFGINDYPGATPKQTTDDLSLQVTSYEAMYILGGLITALKQRREALLSSLKELIPNDNL